MKLPADAMKDAVLVLPKMHAELLKRGGEAIWRRCSEVARLQWCALARLDSDRCPHLPWPSLSDAERQRLDLALTIVLNFIRNVGELHAEAAAA